MFDTLGGKCQDFAGSRTKKPNDFSMGVPDFIL